MQGAMAAEAGWAPAPFAWSSPTDTPCLRRHHREWAQTWQSCERIYLHQPYQRGGRRSSGGESTAQGLSTVQPGPCPFRIAANRGT